MATLWYDKRSIMRMAHLYRRGVLGEPPVTMAVAMRRAWAEEKTIAQRRHQRQQATERDLALHARLATPEPGRPPRPRHGLLVTSRGVPTGRIQGGRW